MPVTNCRGRDNLGRRVNRLFDLADEAIHPVFSKAIVKTYQAHRRGDRVSFTAGRMELRRLYDICVAQRSRMITDGLGVLQDISTEEKEAGYSSLGWAIKSYDIAAQEEDDAEK